MYVGRYGTSRSREAPSTGCDGDGGRADRSSPRCWEGLVRAYMNLRDEMFLILDKEELRELWDEGVRLFPDMQEPPEFNPNFPSEIFHMETAASEAQTKIRMLGGWIQGLINELTLDRRLRMEAEEKPSSLIGQSDSVRTARRVWRRPPTRRGATAPRSARARAAASTGTSCTPLSARAPDFRLRGKCRRRAVTNRCTLRRCWMLRALAVSDRRRSPLIRRMTTTGSTPSARNAAVQRSSHCAESRPNSQPCPLASVAATTRVSRARRTSSARCTAAAPRLSASSDA